MAVAGALPCTSLTAVRRGVARPSKGVAVSETMTVGTGGTAVVPPRRSRLAVSASYAAQGAAYAAVVTALPVFKDRYGLDDLVASGLILIVVITAALGSLLADWLAVRWGSRVALITGLAIEAIALVTAAMPVPLPVFIAAITLFGIGLGSVDASSAMQGVLVQGKYGRQLLGGFFACYTVAAMLTALAMSLSISIALGGTIALLAAGVLAALVAIWGVGSFDRDRAAREPRTKGSVKLPSGGIMIFGFVIFAAFTLDSTVSTWSTVYLHDTLAVGAAIAPLGYAAYQLAILVTRLVTDRLSRRWGAPGVAMITAAAAIVGCVSVAMIGSPVAVIIGFALAGVGTGALVPLAFSGAGRLVPARSDEVIARVNLFNYAGAVIGGVIPGILSEGVGLGLAFLLPAIVLVPIVGMLRWFAR